MEITISEQRLKEIVRDAIDEKHTEFWVDAEQHYLDHNQIKMCREHKEEWVENHRVMTEIRGSAETVKKISVRTAVVVITTAALGWLAYVFNLRIPGQ